MKKILRFSIICAVSIMALFGILSQQTPQSVQAAACTKSYMGGGGGGALVTLAASSGSIDSAVGKVSTEFTPSQSWNTGSTLFSGYSFAKSDCTPANAGLNFSISGTTLQLQFNYQGRSSAFVSGTDYKDIRSGVTFSSTDNAYLTANYSLGSIATDTAQLISVDIGSEAGWAKVSVKQGNGSELALVSFKLPASTTSFLTTNGTSTYISYGEASFSGQTCSAVSGMGEVKVRVLQDSVAASLTANPDTYAQCANYDKTSYNSVTKTASLKYNTSGESTRHTLNGSIGGSTGFETPTKEYVYSYNSLNTVLDNGNYYMNDSFISSSSAATPIYMAMVASDDGKATPKNVPYPVVGGVFNFSAGDIDLTAHDITIDVSSAKKASLAHNFGSITTDGTFSLFAVKDDADTYVGVCPGATSVEQVDTTCSDLYFLKDGETKSGATASVVTVGVTKFWKVDGLTGTGVFSSTIGVIPGVANTGLDKNSAKTGFIALGLFGSLAAVIQIKSKIRAPKRR